MVNTLSLMTGIDIPIEECSLIIHQPTLKEIAYVGEKKFFLAASVLTIDKDLYINSYSEEGLQNINLNNFEVFLMIIQNESFKEKKDAVVDILKIFFPSYKIILTPRALVFNLHEETFIIDESNFEYFQDTISRIICSKKADRDDFNPANEKAREIAEKLKRGRQRVAAQKDNTENSGTSLLTQYISTLVVGLGSMSLSEVLNLTLFQMYDLIERYSLYMNWDLDLKVRLAGGTPDKEVESWMKSIH